MRRGGRHLAGDARALLCDVQSRENITNGRLPPAVSSRLEGLVGLSEPTYLIF